MLLSSPISSHFSPVSAAAEGSDGDDSGALVERPPFFALSMFSDDDNDDEGQSQGNDCDAGDDNSLLQGDSVFDDCYEEDSDGSGSSLIVDNCLDVEDDDGDEWCQNLLQGNSVFDDCYDEDSNASLEENSEDVSKNRPFKDWKHDDAQPSSPSNARYIFINGIRYYYDNLGDGSNGEDVDVVCVDAENSSGVRECESKEIFC